MNILITGGAGFIGSHLCERLLQSGHRVICLDNMCTGSMRHIDVLKRSSNFTFVEHDVRHAYEFQVEQIYNLACPASPVHYQSEAINTLETSTLGMTHALQLAMRTHARVLQTSTSEVYGDPEVHPQHEDYWGHVNCFGPRACYDEGKRVAETLIYEYHRLHQIEARIARIFNTYGPRMLPNDGRAVSNFVVAALHNQPITIYGDGSQTRSFCYIDDMVTGLITLMDSDVPCMPVNLGNPQEYTIADLAESVVKLSGSHSALTYHKIPKDDPKRRRPDIGRAKSLLGWQPQTDLQTGLKQTIDYFRTVL